MIYLDNAATSFPKPERVCGEVGRVLRQVGGNPGRGGHRMSIEAGRVIFEAREAVAELFNIRDSSRIVFTKNCTEALNLAIKGVLSPGDHVVATNIEHNSVTRPLKTVEANGVEVTKVKGSGCGFVDHKDICAAIRGNTKMVIVTYASNVIGAINPIPEIGKECREKGINFLVDAAQAAGLIPIDVEEDGIDLFACPGHKCLFGPQGTGFLYVREGVKIKPLMEGGTGEDGDDENQPLEMPALLESGTLNTPGIGGLAKGVNFILAKGIKRILDKDRDVMNHLLDGLSSFDSVKIFGPLNADERVGLISFIVDGIDPVEIGTTLDERYGIMVRTGLHCAYDAHKAIGTFPHGAVRVSPNCFNSHDHIDAFLKAMREIIKAC